MVAGDFEAPAPAEAESGEERVLELELELPEDQATGELRLGGYALFYACDSVGICRYLRRDFSVRFTVDPSAVRLR